MDAIQMHNHRGKEIRLDITGKRGGEGTVYKFSQDSKECAKIYHSNRVTQELHEKVWAMVHNPPDDPTLAAMSHRSIAWPKAVLYWDEQLTQFAGFSMPLLDTDLFQESYKYYGSADRIERFGGAFTWAHLFTAAFNITSAVAALHHKGHRIGDLREANIFISPDALATLIDCDSFQVKDSVMDKQYYCRVGTGEYMAPELIGVDFKEQDIDREYSDRFALGILIFKLLMNGYHPFASRGPLVESAASTVEKISMGYFAFEGIIKNLEPPADAPPYHALIPPELQELFHRCFVDGHGDERARPPPEEWFDALQAGVRGIRKLQRK